MNPALAALLSGATFIALSPIFVREALAAGVGPTAAAFWRVFLKVSSAPTAPDRGRRNTMCGLIFPVFSAASSCDPQYVHPSWSAWPRSASSPRSWSAT